MGTRLNNDDAFAATNRGGIIENKHNIHAAIVDGNGDLLYGIGDPSRVTLARSAVKPIQALAILKTKADQLSGFDDADLALMCASHSGEARHIERARDMLSKISVHENEMQCGGHPSLSTHVNTTWAKEGFVPTPLCSNCSGKHAGMLAGSKALGADIGDYHLPNHPMQKLVMQTVADACDLEPNEVLWGVDGCNLPTPAFPLDRLARIYAKLAAAADKTDNVDDRNGDSANLGRIYNAMASYPELIAGDDRYCTILMKAFNGDLIGKLGADGCYGIGIRDSDDTRRLGSNNGLGIAVKIDDGSIDVLYAVVSELLEQLNIGTAENRNCLESFRNMKRLNSKGIDVGGISFHFKPRSYRKTDTDSGAE